MLAALHAVTPPARWPWDLRGRCDEAFARIDQATWRRAIERCEALLDTQPRLVLLHGDLHLGNVLDGGPSRGLVAIDPKACVGDPCFDAVDYVAAGADDRRTHHPGPLIPHGCVPVSHLGSVSG